MEILVPPGPGPANKIGDGPVYDAFRPIHPDPPIRRANSPSCCVSIRYQPSFVRFDAGETLWRGGTEARGLYVILSRRVRVASHGAGRPIGSRRGARHGARSRRPSTASARRGRRDRAGGTPNPGEGRATAPKPGALKPTADRPARSKTRAQGPGNIPGKTLASCHIGDPGPFPYSPVVKLFTILSRDMEHALRLMTARDHPYAPARVEPR